MRFRTHRGPFRWLAVLAVAVTLGALAAGARAQPQAAATATRPLAHIQAAALAAA
jgi:hypothetical protein